MVEGPKQINILLALAFVSGFASLTHILLFPLLLVLTYFLPLILSYLHLFELNQYNAR